MKNKNILSGIYYKLSASYPFKDIYGLSMRFYNCNVYKLINRKIYRIYDLELWFESDFKDGEKLIVKRVSGNGRYYFPRHMKNFDY